MTEFTPHEEEQGRKAKEILSKHGELSNEEMPVVIQHSPTPFKELFGWGLKAIGTRLVAEFFVGFGSTRIPSEIITEEIGKVNSEEQAKFIAIATNSHDALLEIARTAECPCVDSGKCGWCKKRDAAIAQAEPKP